MNCDIFVQIWSRLCLNESGKCFHYYAKCNDSIAQTSMEINFGKSDSKKVIKVGKVLPTALGSSIILIDICDYDYNCDYDYVRTKFNFNWKMWRFCSGTKTCNSFTMNCMLFMQGILRWICALLFLLSFSYHVKNPCSYTLIIRFRARAPCVLSSLHSKLK